MANGVAMKIVVKHLSREFDRRPKWIREQLRRES